MKVAALSLFVWVAFSNCNGNDPIKEKRNAIAAELEKEAKRVYEIKTFSFDDWSQVQKPNSEEFNKYMMPEQKDDADKTESGRFWKSASNFGYSMKDPRAKAEDFPVYFAEPGRSGKGLRLRTNEGLMLFGMGSYIIPGSLYNGLLKHSELLLTPLKATMFGTGYALKPIKLIGYYKFKAGEKYINGKTGKGVEGKDQGSITSVFYEITSDETYLNGETLYTDARIVAVAKFIADDTEGDEWKQFEAKFETINEEAMKTLDFGKKKYRLAIVMSSSAKGDLFLGAVGSTLCVDELQVKGESLKNESK